MSSILSVKGLTKRYKRLTAVNELNLEISAGGVFGLLGPNGSGKTTTLGMVLGVIRPTSGSYSWFGEGATHEQRKKLGAILEKPNFYPHQSAAKNLELVCLIKNVGKQRIDEVLTQVNLIERKEDPFKTYSLGMKQRLAIASALLADPEILILDEPTNGLDPQGIAEIRQLIIQISEMGKTVILASHLLDEVQKVCSEFGVLRQGKLIHQGSVDADFNDENIIQVGSTDEAKLKEALANYSAVKSVESKNGHLELKMHNGIAPHEVNEYLMKANVPVNHLMATKKNLEEQFLEILNKQA